MPGNAGRTSTLTAREPEKWSGIPPQNGRRETHAPPNKKHQAGWEARFFYWIVRALRVRKAVTGCRKNL